MPDALHNESEQTIARVFQARRFVQILTPLAEFFGIDKPDGDLATTRIEFAQTVADQAEISVLNDEHTMADVIVRLAERFKAGALDHSTDAEMIRHIRLEVNEVAHEFGLGTSDDVTRMAALTEIGDAMLLLSRLAMRLGARPLEPLTLAVRKTSARLRVFEDMGGGEHDDPRGLWSIAKRIVMARKS